MNEMDGWKIKCHKGWDTSASEEFKEYIRHNHIVDFVYTDEGTDDAIDKIFNKKRPAFVLRDIKAVCRGTIYSSR